MQTIYRPGQWNTLVVPGALVALPPDAPQALVDTLWERLSAERTLGVVVDAITDSVGGSFAAMPSFVAAVLEGANVRVAVRGDIGVAVTGSEGAEELSGLNVMTWSERFIPGAGRIVLRLSDASDAPELPVIGGIVRAAEVVADIQPGDGVDDNAAAPIAAADASPEIADAPAAAVQAPPPPPIAVVPVAPIADEPVADLTPEPVAEVSAENADEPEEDAADEPATEALDIEAGPEADDDTDAAAEPAVAEAQPDDAVDGRTLIPEGEQTLGSDFDEFEQLFGDTVHSVPHPPLPPAAIAGDHDGATISVAEARALRSDLPPVPQIEPEAATALLPTVDSGRVRVSTGQVVALDRTVVIGRRPRAPRASGASLPHLIAVESPQQDISRSHLEIRPEGDTVVVVDLHTTNGSTLLRPGADPVRLHPGEQTLVLTGDVIDLGDGVTVAFEDLP